MESQFLDLYNRELGYLRQLGGEFASAYPAVAGRLGLDEFACADPFVERLLEGFAFLAARVHRRLDAEFPQFTGGLLQSVYPHFTRPIPSAAIVSVQPDADEGSLASGYRLPAGSQLRGPTSPNCPTPCRFDTTQDLDLWPIRLVDVQWVQRGLTHHHPIPGLIDNPSIRSCLCLTLETTGGLPMSALSLDYLPIHLRGGEIACQLLEMIVAHGQMAIAGDRDADQWHRIDSRHIAAGGFQDHEALLPEEPRTFSGYRLLQEYFLLPEKFLFLNIGQLAPAVKSANGRRLEIVIGCDASDADLASRLTREHLQLHCVPAINLFQRRADRIQISDAAFEHQLLVDRSRPMDFEIWSVERLFGHGKTPQQEIEFLPLYAPPRHMAARSQHAACYTLDRRPRQPSANQRQYGHRSPYLGSEVFVTLTDSGQQPLRHEVRQLSSTVYCTNRDLPLIKPVAGWKDAFTLDGPGPVARIECLTGPTPPRSPLTAAQGERCWRLVHHLTTNLLSLNTSQRADSGAQHADSGTQGDDRSAAAQLREMLALYCPGDQPSARRQIDGIMDVRMTAVTRQLPVDGPIVHGRGAHIDLLMDDTAFEGSGAFLLGSILEQFLARYATLNSFAQSSLRTLSRGRVYRWPVRTGTAALV